MLLKGHINIVRFLLLMLFFILLLFLCSLWLIVPLCLRMSSKFILNRSTSLIRRTMVMMTVLRFQALTGWRCYKISRLSALEKSSVFSLKIRMSETRKTQVAVILKTQANGIFLLLEKKSIYCYLLSLLRCGMMLEVWGTQWDSNSLVLLCKFCLLIIIPSEVP